MTKEMPPIPNRKEAFLFMKYDKPFLTYDQLIDLMISRGIMISDRASAKNLLANVSYYNLMNGCKDILKFDASGNNLLYPIDIHDLYLIYRLDRSLNGLLLKYILKIECRLKSHLSYTVSERFGVFTPFAGYKGDGEDYLAKKNYSNSNKKRDSTLRQLKQVLNIEDPHFHHSDSLVYYYNHHNHIPAWILTTSIPFGLAALWFSILRRPEKNEIVLSLLPQDEVDIGEKKEFLSVSLGMLRDYRNCIAHVGKTFGYQGRKLLPRIAAQHLSKGIVSEEDFVQNPSASSGVFAIIVCIMILLGDSASISEFIKELKFTFGDSVTNQITIHDQPILQLLGLPEDIFKRLEAFL